MTTPDPNKPDQQEDVSPAGAPEQRPGIATESAADADIAGSAAPQADQVAQDAAAQKRRQSEIEFLKWEELIEQLKVLDPESKTQPVPNYWQSYILFINSNLDGTPENNKFVVPKVIETSGINNAVVFKELLDNVKLFTAIDSQRNLMASASETGAYDISQKGIFFKAGTNPDTKAKAPFTESEAKGIALLAMHNRDLLPPGSLRITGNPEQRAMIYTEIKKLNELLPENARMIISNENEIDKTLVAKFSQEPVAKGGPETGPTQTAEKTDAAPDPQRAFKTVTEPREFTPEEISAAQDNFLGKTSTGTAPTDNATDSTVAIIEAADANAQKTAEEKAQVQKIAEINAALKAAAQNDKDNSIERVSAEGAQADNAAGEPEADAPALEAADDSEDGPTNAEQQLQKMKERINGFSRQDILNDSKKIGTTESRHHVYSRIIHIDDATESPSTEVVFTAPKKGERQIISIGKTDFFEGYESKDIKVKIEPRDKLDAAFPTAASGEPTSEKAAGTSAAAPKADEPRLTA